MTLRVEHQAMLQGTWALVHLLGCNSLLVDRGLVTGGACHYWSPCHQGVGVVTRGGICLSPAWLSPGGLVTAGCHQGGCHGGLVDGGLSPEGGGLLPLDWIPGKRRCFLPLWSLTADRGGITPAVPYSLIALLRVSSASWFKTRNDQFFMRCSWIHFNFQFYDFMFGQIHAFTAIDLNKCSLLLAFFSSPEVFLLGSRRFCFHCGINSLSSRFHPEKVSLLERCGFFSQEKFLITLQQIAFRFLAWNGWCLFSLRTSVYSHLCTWPVWPHGKRKSLNKKQRKRQRVLTHIKAPPVKGIPMGDAFVWHHSGCPVGSVT